MKSVAMFGKKYFSKNDISSFPHTNKESESYVGNKCLPK